LERTIFSDLKLNKTVAKSKLYDINILLVEDALSIYKKQTANGGRE
jgi:hypothetical protein